MHGPTSFKKMPNIVCMKTEESREQKRTYANCRLLETSLIFSENMRPYYMLYSLKGICPNRTLISYTFYAEFASCLFN